MIENEHQRIDEAADPKIDLDDCTRLRIEILLGYCTHIQTYLILGYLNAFIGGMILFISSVYKNEISTVNVVSMTVTVFSLLMGGQLLCTEVLKWRNPNVCNYVNAPGVDLAYPPAVNYVELCCSNVMISSVFFVALTFCTIYERDWVALAWLYKDPEGGLKAILLALYFCLYWMWWALAHQCRYDCEAFVSVVSQDSNTQSHEMRLKRRAEPFLRLLGQLTRQSILRASVEGFGIEFPKGIGFETLWLAPDLIPKKPEESSWCYLKYIFFVQLSKCLGCDYENVMTESKDCRSTFNVAARNEK